jgi:hypothetical protein
MSKTNVFETDFLELIFNGTTIDDIAENDTTSPAANLYVSLHTSDPGEAGDQTTNEATYTGYARVAVARSGAGWTVSGNNCSNAATFTFGECTAGSETITHFGIGTGSSGVGYLLFKGAITSPVSGLAVSAGIAPEFNAGDIDINED